MSRIPIGSTWQRAFDDDPDYPPGEHTVTHVAGGRVTLQMGETTIEVRVPMFFHRWERVDGGEE